MINLIRLFCCCVSLTFAAPASADDLDELAGTWNFVSTSTNSDKQENRSAMRIVFDGTRIAFFVPGGKQAVKTGTYKVDPAKNLKTIDITLDNAGKNETTLAIYEVSGDTLRICHYLGASAAKERPTEFKADRKTALGVLKRETPDEKPAAKQVELKKGDRIVFFGDSLTHLAGDEQPKEHVRKGYVRIVRETLQQKHNDKNIEVDWVATGGHTVPDLLNRVDKDVIAKKPTIVVIQIGCNDARRIPRESFKASLETLIDKLQKAGIQVVQCSLTSVGEKHDGTNKDDPKLDEFAQIQREVAKAKNVPLNDLRRAFVAHWKKNNRDNKPSGILTYDGNHFNQKGHDFVAEQMLGMFR